MSGYAALALPLPGQQVVGANERIRVAMIGCGQRSHFLVSQFAKLEGVEVAALCDPDTAQMDGLAADLSRQGIDLGRAAHIRDYRALCERGDIDAVMIASCNHWHALHAIEAMASGKDVYVEKPVTHTVWEGRQLVAAARKYGRVAAAGYQNRSDPGPIEGIRFLHEGGLGAIRSVHVCCFRNRAGIGKRATPLVPPATVDHHLWLGPAEDLPMYRPSYHYDWHWVWNTGDGDIGNQCPHEIDLANWVLREAPLPSAIGSFGNRFAWDDAGETPNLMAAWYEQAGIPVIIEVNDMKVAPDRDASPVRDEIRVGIIVRCEGGELRGGRGGMYAVGEDGKTRTHRFPGEGGNRHQQNFIDAVRAGSSAGLTAPVHLAESSATIAQLANIAYRIGSPAETAEFAGILDGQPGLRRIVDDQAAQLKAWGIDAPVYHLGRSLAIDPATAAILTPGVNPHLAHPPGRAEFVVPDVAELTAAAIPA